MPVFAPPSDHTFDATLTLDSERETTHLAQALAPVLGLGDVVLLGGPIGAGKTAFARALIQAKLALAGAPPEDVPSPTFTLVQTYDAGKLEIWHADLYRLTHPDEVAELGLEDAFTTALCLVEWPDRLGTLAPQDALTMTFSPGDASDTRYVTFFGGAHWKPRLVPVIELSNE